MRTHQSGPVVRVASNWTIGDRWKQLLLSLANATFLLGIVFAVLALILVSKVETFSENMLNDVKLGLLKEIDADVESALDAIGTTEKELELVADQLNKLVKDPQISLSPLLIKEMQAIRTELHKVRLTAAAMPAEAASQLLQRIEKATERSTIAISPSALSQLRVLNRELGSMQTSLAELTSLQATVSDHAIRSIASAIASAIIDIRQCRSERTGPS